MKPKKAEKKPGKQLLSAVFRPFRPVQAAPLNGSGSTSGKCTERCTSRILVEVRNYPFPRKAICLLQRTSEKREQLFPAVFLRREAARTLSDYCVKPAVEPAGSRLPSDSSVQ